MIEITHYAITIYSPTKICPIKQYTPMVQASSIEVWSVVKKSNFFFFEKKNITYVELIQVPEITYKIHTYNNYK